MTSPHWESSGDGPPLLLIQGLGYPAQMWFRLAPLLSARLRVISFDNRGAGANAALPVDDLTIEQLAQDAAAVIRDSTGQASVLGVSLGGIVAQELALSHPELVDRLVLVSTHSCDEHAVNASEQVLRMLATRSALPPAEARRASVPYAYSLETSRELIEQDLACRDEHPVAAETYQAQLEAAGRFAGTSRRLPGLVHETLVLHGDADLIVPVANAELLAARIPHATLRLIDGAGHNLFSERAEDVAREVIGFVIP